MSARQRPRVLAVLPGLFPSTIVNVAKPLLRLQNEHAIDLAITFQFVVKRRQVEQADAVILCHTMDPAHVHVLDDIRRFGTPLIYDIDENLLEPPPDVPGLKFHADPERQAAVRRCVEEAALVRTYSPVLKRYLDPMNGEVIRVDGPIDWSLITDDRAHRSTRVQIVYATSRLDDSIGKMLIVPIRRVLAAHQDVDVTLWGPRLPGLDGDARVRHRGFLRDYDRFFTEFAQAGFDIGLAPMPADLFHQCKTATKFREYAACGIAGVYSDVEMYRDCVTDGVTGLLARASDDEWTAAVSRLIEDAGLRRCIQNRGAAYARERYAPGRMESVWLEHINRVIQERATRTSRLRTARSDVAYVTDSREVRLKADATPEVRFKPDATNHARFKQDITHDTGSPRDSGSRAESAIGLMSDRSPVASGLSRTLDTTSHVGSGLSRTSDTTSYVASGLSRTSGTTSYVASGFSRTSMLAIALGLLRQGFRYSARVPSLLRDVGLPGLWARVRGQWSAIRQLIAWELALRRMQRQSAARKAP